MKKSGQVVVVGGGGISRVHPALARKMRAEGRWHRRRGRAFGLKVVSRRGSAAEGVDGCATAGRCPASGAGSGRRSLWKLFLYGSGPLVPIRCFKHSDARTLRGAFLALIERAFGREVAHALSNHGTSRKSPLAFSISRSNPRRGFVTLLATDDEGVLQVLREAVALFRGESVLIGNGGEGTHRISVKASLVQWECRGVYLDVAASSPEEARVLVPGGVNVARLEGRAGRFADQSCWRVASNRLRRLPPQVGQMGSYGYGVLA